MSDYSEIWRRRRRRNFCVGVGRRRRRPRRRRRREGQGRADVERCCARVRFAPWTAAAHRPTDRPTATGWLNRLTDVVTCECEDYEAGIRRPKLPLGSMSYPTEILAYLRKDKRLTQTPD